MKPTRIDKLFVIWIAAALSLWAWATAVLWSERLDVSGTGPVSALSALLAAVALTAGLPGKAARAAQRLLTALRLQDSGAMGLATAASMPPRPQDVGTLMRLLALSSVLTAVGGLLSTGAVLAAPALEEAAAGRFALGAWGWAAFRFAVEVVGLLPMGLGVGLTFLVTVLIRGGSGRDHYGTVFREWLAGAAVGLAGAAGAWWLAADLLGVSLVAAVAVLAAAAFTVQRVKLTIRPRRVMDPVVSAGQRGRRLAVAAGFAGVTAALAVQVRLLRDLAEAGPGAQALWTGASVWLLVRYLAKADGRSRPPGLAQAAGGVIGLFCGLVFQGALAVRFLAGGPEAAACGLLAVAAQVPLAALAGMTVSRQRRQFATGGGRAREYVATAAAAACGALLCSLVAGSLGIGGILAVGVAIVGIVSGVVRGMSTARRWDRQLQWAVLGAGLIGVTGSAAVVAVRGLPALRAGRWLTTARRSGPPAPGAAVDWALGPPRWRSGEVTAAGAGLLARHAGRWWVTAGAAADVAVAEGAEGARWSAPDPTACRRGHGGGAFLSDTVRDRSWFDGVLIAALPADHPEAWRCYAPSVLRRCRRKLVGGGVMALRTQARPGRVDDALAVAQGFAEAVRDGWALVAVGPEGVDVLLTGPKAAGRPEAAGGARVVPLDRLLAGRAPGAARRLSGRGWVRAGRTTVEALRRRLTGVQAARSGKAPSDSHDICLEPRRAGGD